MKCVIEFGNRGGSHIDNLIFPNVKLAVKTACAIGAMITNDPFASPARNGFWLINKNNPRRIWQSKTHFIAISILDGVERGCASAGLWHKRSIS